MSADFLIGTDEAGEPVYLPDAIRCEHVTIIGATGTGKTNLLERMILSDIENETSCVVIDAHGDITRAVIDKASPAARLFLLEVWPDRPFGINLLEPQGTADTEKRADDVLLVLKRMFGGESEFRPQVEHDLNLVIRTLLANEDCTLAEALELLTDRDLRDRLVSRLTNRALVASWKSFNDLKPHDQANRISPLFNRLSPFLGSDLIRCIVGQSHTTAPLWEAINMPEFTLLVSLPIGGTGSEIRSKFLGSLLVCHLTQMIFDRTSTSPEKPSRVHLYLDEYGRYATPTTARLFSEGRKYNFSLTVAHQTRADMEGTGNETAELQAGTLICFSPSSGEDAETLASTMPITPRPAEEPPKALTLNPFRQLLEGKHPAEATQTYVREALVPLQQRIDSREEVEARWLQKLTVGEMMEARGSIEALFIDAMKQQVSPTSDEFRDRLADTVALLMLHFGFAWEYISDHEGEAARTWAHELIRRIVSNDEMWVRGKRFFLYGDVFGNSNPPHPLHDVKLENLLMGEGLVNLATDSRYYAERLHNEREIYALNARKAYNFMNGIYRLCQLLSDDPIFLTVPGYAGRPQQTYADARAELANGIKGLPKYQAYIRLRTQAAPVVQRVRTFAAVPQEGSFAWQRQNTPLILNINPDSGSPSGMPRERLDRCRKWFGTPKEEVEAEIEQRRQRLLETPVQRPDGRNPGDDDFTGPTLRPSIGRRSPNHHDMPQIEQPASSSGSTNMRVYELAKELGVENRAVMNKLQELGIFAHSAASMLDETVVHTVTEAFLKKHEERDQ